MEQVDTFDLLLFKIDNTGGKVIRMYTASEWGKSIAFLIIRIDHVAMVLRFQTENS